MKQLTQNLIFKTKRCFALENVFQGQHLKKIA